MSGEISHCIGEYDPEDSTCVGDQESTDEEERKPCSWHKHCSVFTEYLEEKGKTAEDYFDTGETVDEDGEKQYFAIPKGGHKRFEKFCQFLIEAKEEENKKDSDQEEKLPKPPPPSVKVEEPEEEPEPEEDSEEVEADEEADEEEDEEEDEEQEDEEESEPEEVEAVEEDEPQKKKKKRKTRSDRIDRRKQGPTNFAKKRAAAALTERAKEARSTLISMFAEFRKQFLDELGNGYEFVKADKIARPGQFMTVNRAESDYISVYCKKIAGRDVPIARFRMKTYSHTFVVDLPLTVEELKENLSKKVLDKMNFQPAISGRFVSQALEVNKEKLSILAESLAKMVNNGTIKLPTV